MSGSDELRALSDGYGLAVAMIEELQSHGHLNPYGGLMHEAVAEITSQLKIRKSMALRVAWRARQETGRSKSNVIYAPPAEVVGRVERKKEG